MSSNMYNPSTSKKRKKHRKHHHERPSKKLKEGAPPQDIGTEENIVQPSPKNPADGVSIMSLFENNIKSTVIRTAVPQGSSDINSSNYWQFNIKSSKHEFIRFHETSLSFTLFGTYDNTTANEQAAANTKERAKRHALVSHLKEPTVLTDPTPKGSVFVKSVDVAINNVNCPTNALITPHLPQYARMSGIYRKKPEPYFAHAEDFSNDQTGELIDLARDPVDYGVWNATEGKRVQVPLPGIFPFGNFNKTRESIDKMSHQPQYFPPDTDISVRVNLWQNKAAGIFHSKALGLIANYLDTNDESKPEKNMRFTIQDVQLEYEVLELKEEAYIKVMNAFKQGSFGIMKYDVIRTQHQPITQGQSFGVHRFNLPADCRIVYLLCLNDWASTLMESKHKPISGFTRFPPNSTKIKITFSGGNNNICEEFVNFGKAGKTNEISQKIWYEALRSRRMFGGKFSELFPPTIATTDAAGVTSTATNTSIIGAFVFDLEDKKSTKTEEMSVSIQYGDAQSKANLQFVCISVHTNGMARFKLVGNAEYNWEWAFQNPL